MPPEPSEAPETVAIEELEALGLSAYAARTFVALARIGEGTARDVSDDADVPRTRVYDAIEELQDYGLVDVQRTSPKRFWSVSAETTSRRFEQEVDRRVGRLAAALDTLETSPQREEQRGVWTVTGHESVTDRVIEFLDGAEDEIVFMTIERLLTEEVVEVLRAASDRGVDIKLAGMAEAAEADLESIVPEADQFDSLWDWSNDPAGRLLLVDRRQTLVSVLLDNGEDDGTPRDETAIWGSGETNSLVVVLQAMFTWTLGEGKA